jgi:hypothetical protein
MFTPSFTPRVNYFYCFEEWRSEQRISTPGDYFSPRGQNSPMRSNFSPWGEVKNGLLVPECGWKCILIF